MNEATIDYKQPRLSLNMEIWILMVRTILNSNTGNNRSFGVTVLCMVPNPPKDSVRIGRQEGTLYSCVCTANGRWCTCT